MYWNWKKFAVTVAVIVAHVLFYNFLMEGNSDFVVDLLNTTGNIDDFFSFLGKNLIVMSVEAATAAIVIVFYGGIRLVWDLLSL